MSSLKSVLSPEVLATKIYYPSYISLESALSFYEIIPEAVFTITSVTTRKTKDFNTPWGRFSFQKIKKTAFGFFEPKKDEGSGLSFNLALPEKALVDFFYFNKNILNGEKLQFESYRFERDFKYSKSKLLKFAKVLKNKKTLFLTQKFIQFYVAS